MHRFQKDIFERYNEAQVEKSHYGDNIERIQRICYYLQLTSFQFQA